MRTIIELQKEADRLRKVVDEASISPEDTFGLQAGALDYLAQVELNASALGVRQAYQTVEEMEADAEPYGANDKQLRFGQLVSVYNTADADYAANGNIYAWQGADAEERWMLIGNIADLDAVYLRLDELNAGVASATALTAQMQTDIGTLQTRATAINGRAQAAQETADKALAAGVAAQDAADAAQQTADAAQQAANDALDAGAIAQEAANKAQLTADAAQQVASQAPDVAMERVEALVGKTIAPLDGNGLVPASYLPAYVDDVVEIARLYAWSYGADATRLPEGATDKRADSAGCRVVYIELGAWTDGEYGEVEAGLFLEDSSGAATQWYSEWSGMSTWADDLGNGLEGKVYICTADCKTYRWGGARLVVIGSDLALGETSSTAFAGSRGVALEQRVGELEKDADDLGKHAVALEQRANELEELLAQTDSKMAVMTQEEYDELDELNPNVFYFIVEDE